MRRAGFSLAALAVAAALGATAGAAGASPPVVAAKGERQSFVERVTRLSDSGAFFDTDNLISNESSYGHVLGALERLEVHGGVYLGVGPDQNFAYIARIRPTLAFIVDIRRDNLLQHLLFKALFELSPTRVEYLVALYGRAPPADPSSWESRPLGEVTGFVDQSRPLDDHGAGVRRRVGGRISSFGLALDDSDRATIDRFHRTFIDSGLSLRFQTFGRPPRSFYPTHRQLLHETDLEGRPASFLGSEASYQVVRELQLADRVVPVVGDLGSGVLGRVGALLDELGMAVSALYTSNVEFYLWRQGTFGRYAAQVSALPRDQRSVIIRSYFGDSWGSPHPAAVAGYHSTQLLQHLADFAEVHRGGGFRGYGDLVLRQTVELRSGALGRKSP